MGKLTRPSSGRAGACCTLMAALMVLGAGGCTGGEDNEAKPSSSSPSQPRPSTAESSDRAENIEGETVAKAPKPVDGEVLLSVASRKGNATLPVKNEIGAGRLGVQVNCQGKGTLTVSVKPVGLSFPLKCVEHEVSSTYNEIQLKRARSEGIIQITASPTISWALTVEQ
ncbi:hypothetical protein ACIHCQ_42475 [Streptomyces sp. NPDC052236]|uniref:hypothetical protein n=1 Tax=Streptomyces sp. NPDC052236 TaxID=3365686 RepID=UPI0037CDE83F